MTNPTVRPPSLLGYSVIARLGHDDGRLDELAPRLEELFEAIAALEEIDVRGVEMAVTYLPWLEYGNG